MVTMHVLLATHVYVYMCIYSPACLYPFPGYKQMNIAYRMCIYAEREREIERAIEPHM